MGYERAGVRRFEVSIGRSTKCTERARGRSGVRRPREDAKGKRGIVRRKREEQKREVACQNAARWEASSPTFVFLLSLPYG